MQRERAGILGLMASLLGLWSCRPAEPPVAPSEIQIPRENDPPEKRPPGAALPAPAAARPSRGATAMAQERELSALQQQHAPGSQEATDLLTDTLHEGQTLTAEVILRAGKCYTGIAVAEDSAEVAAEVSVVFPPGAPVSPTSPQIPLASSIQGRTAILGPEGNCFRNMIPLDMPAFFRITLKKGQGPVSARLYAR